MALESVRRVKIEAYITGPENDRFKYYMDLEKDSRSSRIRFLIMMELQRLDAKYGQVHSIQDIVPPTAPGPVNLSLQVPKGYTEQPPISLASPEAIAEAQARLASEQASKQPLTEPEDEFTDEDFDEADRS